ncbi:MAG: class I SAM-dependent methyltransferase [Planctomycetes bacterium]|nr:class I SAM-dependent methyltransferase [Planctomycetota bacterium]
MSSDRLVLILIFTAVLGAAVLGFAPEAHSQEAATPEDVVEKMLRLAGVEKHDVVCDLGSGDGRIVIAAARRYGCQAVGYEIDAKLVQLSREKVEKAKLQDLVTIHQADFFTRDFSSASVVTMFLPPAVIERLMPKLAKLAPGTRIVSHYQAIEGVRPDKQIGVRSASDGRLHPLYLWITPLGPTDTSP